MKNLTEINLEKSRSGVYKDNEENRRLHRVGQRYGSPGREQDPAATPLNNRRGGSIVNRSGGFVEGSAERAAQLLRESKEGTERKTEDLLKKFKEEVEHHQQELDNLEAKKEQYVKQNGQSKYDERKKKIEDALDRAKKEAMRNAESKKPSKVKNGGESLGDIESIMEDISDKFFNSKVSAKEKRTYIENYIGEGEYDRLWQKLSSKQFDSSTDKNNAFMEEVFEVLMNKQSVQSKPEAKTPSKVKIDEDSKKQGKEKFSRVNLPDIPNAHKVNLSKYLSAKRKKAVDDAWDKAKFDSVSREKAGVFQEGYNKLREQFNNNFDDMSKAERAELLYKILKMKNAMEKK